MRKVNNPVGSPSADTRSYRLVIFTSGQVPCSQCKPRVFWLLNRIFPQLRWNIHGRTSPHQLRFCVRSVHASECLDQQPGPLVGAILKGAV